MNRRNEARFASSALLLSALLAASCQKKDSSAACGTSVAGAAATSSGGIAGEVGVAGTGTAAGAGNAASGGEVSTGGMGGAVSLGMGGSGAAAATGGLEATGGSGGAPPDSSQCAQLAVADCATGMNCQALSGQAITGDPQCLSAFAVVSCGTTIGCTPTATRATDTGGHDWVFPTTCIPATWTNSTSSGTRFDACAETPDGGM